MGPNRKGPRPPKMDPQKVDIGRRKRSKRETQKCPRSRWTGQPELDPRPPKMYPRKSGLQGARGPKKRPKNGSHPDGPKCPKPKTVKRGNRSGKPPKKRPKKPRTDNTSGPSDLPQNGPLKIQIPMAPRRQKGAILASRNFPQRNPRLALRSRKK